MRELPLWISVSLLSSLPGSPLTNYFVYSRLRIAVRLPLRAPLAQTLLVHGGVSCVWPPLVRASQANWVTLWLQLLVVFCMGQVVLTAACLLSLVLRWRRATQFIAGCTTVVVSGSVANFYWNRGTRGGRNNNKSPLLWALGTTFCCHLGSIALGSFVVAVGEACSSVSACGSARVALIVVSTLTFAACPNPRSSVFCPGHS